MLKCDVTLDEKAKVEEKEEYVSFFKHKVGSLEFYFLMYAHFIGDHQCGFRRNRSTTDHIFCIRQILEKINGNTMKQCISSL